MDLSQPAAASTKSETLDPTSILRVTAGWQYDPDLLTEVAVTFRPVGDIETEVTLEHRKLENYGEGAGQMVGIFASPGGWPVALDRLPVNVARLMWIPDELEGTTDEKLGKAGGGEVAQPALGCALGLACLGSVDVLDPNGVYSARAAS